MAICGNMVVEEYGTLYGKGGAGTDYMLDVHLCVVV